MFHYLFTNDLRIKNLRRVLIEAARCFRDDCVPSANEDKNANNNMSTLGFYFNLTNNSNCAVEAANGNVRKVVLNFIKKFQFPNPRTKESLNNCIEDGISLAPMRVVLKALYIMSMAHSESAYLTRYEIMNFIFFNEKVAKIPNPSVIELVNDILIYRKSGEEGVIPDDETLINEQKYWKQCDRQIREMVKVLCWSGCVKEENDKSIRLADENLTKENKAEIFDIVNYNGFWEPLVEASYDDNRRSYEEYMDVEHIEDNTNIEEQKMRPEYLYMVENKEFIFACLDLMKEKNLFNNDTLSILQSKEKCASMFKHNSVSGILVHVDKELSEGEQEGLKIGADGRRRYYDERYQIGNEEYFVSSEWRKVTEEINPREAFVEWVFSMMKGTGYQSKFARNRIVFGAPGTGKSFTINKERKELLGSDNETDYERVTFHPDYSYANFVGTYKPVPSIDSEGKDIISYEYVPGPFMRMYVKALKNSRTDNIKPFLLIIEEINRANVAAVFGDVFQILDRGDDFVSEYPIQATEDIKKYLVKELGGNPNDYNKIKIPDNMFIWATMNSADQGVLPMDTAFKRRWDFTYLGIDDNDQDLQGKYVYLADDKSQKVEWNKLRKAINNFLAKEKINEDKQLGPYFISRSIVVPNDSEEIDRDRFINTFKNKVIMYLFEDAAKQKRPRLFEGCFQNSSRYSEICREFEAKGVGIFNCDIQLDCEVEDVKSGEGPQE